MRVDQTVRLELTGDEARALMAIFRKLPHEVVSQIPSFYFQPVDPMRDGEMLRYGAKVLGELVRAIQI